MNTAKQVNMMVGLLMVFAVATLLYFLWDSTRAEDAEERQVEVNAERGGKLYSLNCRACHGLTGMGTLENALLPGLPLNIDSNRPTELGKLAAIQQRFRDTIKCGRVGTLMPPWSREQGGPLNEFQIEQLVLLITSAASEKGWEEAVAEANHTDFLDKQLAEPASESDTVLTLTDARGLKVDDQLRIDDEPLDEVYELVEIVEVREAENEIEVERGVFGTKAAPHKEGTEVFVGPIPPATGPLTGEQGTPPCGQRGVAPAAPPGGAGGAAPTPSAGQPERPATAQEVQAEFVEATDGIIETETQDNFFTVNNFMVKTGQEVTIRVTNSGQAIHNLRTAGLDGEWDSDDDFVTAPDLLVGGDIGEFTFSLDQAAILVFRCDFHPQEMWGQITVSG